MKFVAADWAAVESWLTAFFSRDATLLRVLTQSLNGGHKIHAINAGLIYGIDPADSKTHTIMLLGAKHRAYDGGKRLTHAWSYVVVLEMSDQADLWRLHHYAER